MERTKFKLVRNKHPKCYVVQYKGAKIYYVSSRQYHRVPAGMTKRRAIKIFNRLVEIYGDLFEINKI